MPLAAGVLSILPTGYMGRNFAFKSEEYIYKGRNKTPYVPTIHEYSRNRDGGLKAEET